MLIEVVAVLPAYNESLTVGNAVTEVKRYVTDVIVVDDGSGDQTARSARNAGAHVISHPANRGIGSALMTGYRYACEKGAEVVVQLDADGQHEADDIPNLIASIEDGADIVVASRFLLAPQPVQLWRRLGVQFYSALITLLASYRVTDATSGFRALKAETLRKSRQLPERHWAIYQTLDCLRSGFHYEEVPVSMPPRASGASQFTPGTAVLYHLRVARSVLPMLFDRPEDAGRNPKAAALRQ